jgi:hypothetical protein
LKWGLDSFLWVALEEETRTGNGLCGVLSLRQAQGQRRRRGNGGFPAG